MQKTILITGCSSGIGAALAREFGKRGHRVYATARRAEALAALEADGIRGLALDVNDDASIAAALDTVRRDAGHLDLLVNNAGFSQVGAVVDLTREDLRRQYETNVIAPMAVDRPGDAAAARGGGHEWQCGGRQRRQHRGALHHAVRSRVLLEQGGRALADRRPAHGTQALRHSRGLHPAGRRALELRRSMRRPRFACRRIRSTGPWKRGFVPAPRPGSRTRRRRKSSSCPSWKRCCATRHRGSSAAAPTACGCHC